MLVQGDELGLKTEMFLKPEKPELLTRGVATESKKPPARRPRWHNQIPVKKKRLS